MGNSPTCIIADEERLGGIGTLGGGDGLQTRGAGQPKTRPSQQHAFLKKPTGFTFGSLLEPPRGLLQITSVGASFQGTRIRIQGVERQRVICHVSKAITGFVFSIRVRFTEQEFNHFKVNVSGAFSTFTMSCSHHLYLVPKHFHHPRKNPFTRSPSAPPPPHGPGSSRLLSVSSGYFI